MSYEILLSDDALNFLRSLNSKSKNICKKKFRETLFSLSWKRYR